MDFIGLAKTAKSAMDFMQGKADTDDFEQMSDTALDVLGMVPIMTPIVATIRPLKDQIIRSFHAAGQGSRAVEFEQNFNQFEKSLAELMAKQENISANIDSLSEAAKDELFSVGGY